MIKKIIIVVLFISLFSLASSENLTEELSSNDTLISTNLTVDLPVPELELLKIIPKEVKAGDVQLIIEIKNNKNETVSGLTALVSGNGFSTYDILPSDSIESGQKDYIIVQGNFKRVGNISLTIKINQEIFYENVTVIGEDTSIQEQINTDQETAKKELLTNLSQQLEDLKEKYYSLENSVSEKKENNFDVSKISLDELKKYIRSAESSWLQEDITATRINLRLGIEEYEYQTTRLNLVKTIPLTQRLKENALLFSAIAGSLITFFALSELLKKKSEYAVVKISNIRKGKKKNGKYYKDKRKPV